MKPIKSFRRILAAIGLVLATSLFALPQSEALIVRPGTHSFQQQWPEKPILDCRFTENDCGMTYTGASTRTMFDSTGTMVFAPHNLLENSEWSDGLKTSWNVFGSETEAFQVQSGKISGFNSAFHGEIRRITATGFEGSQNNVTGLLNGAQYTVSFYAKSISGLSSGNPRISGPGLSAQTPVLTEAYQRFSYTFTTNATSGNVAFYSAGGGVGDGFDIIGLQLNRGSSALVYSETTPTAAFYGPRIGTHTFDAATSTWVNRGYKGSEEAQTNLALESRDFDTTWTTLGAPTLTQDQTGIDGVANKAWTIEDGGAGFKGIRQVFTVANDNTTYIASIYIDKDAVTNRFPELQLALSGGTATQSQFIQLNTSTGAIDTSIQNAGTFGVVDSGDWWRVWVTVTNNTTGNVTLTVTFFPAVTTTFGVQESGASGSTVVDQVDVAVGSVVLSPIPTTTAQGARAADVATIAVSNIPGFDENILSVYFKGSVSHDPLPGVQNRAVDLAADAGDVRYAILSDGGNGTNILVRSSGAAGDVIPGSSVWNAGVVHEFMFSFSVNDLAAAFDGGTVGTDNTSGVPTSITTLHIGTARGGITPWNGDISRIIIWSRRLPNGRLQDKTAFLDWWRGTMFAANDNDFSMIEVAA